VSDGQPCQPARLVLDGTVLLQTRHSPSAAILAIPAIGTLKRQAKRSRGSESSLLLLPCCSGACLTEKRAGRTTGVGAVAAVASSPSTLRCRLAKASG
jgi:hypothetical protein